MQLSRHATGGHVPPPIWNCGHPTGPQTPSPRTAPGSNGSSFDTRPGNEMGWRHSSQARSGVGSVQLWEEYRIVEKRKINRLYSAVLYILSPISFLERSGGFKGNGRQGGSSPPRWPQIFWKWVAFSRMKGVCAHLR